MEVIWYNGSLNGVTYSLVAYVIRIKPSGVHAFGRMKVDPEAGDVIDDW